MVRDSESLEQKYFDGVIWCFFHLWKFSYYLPMLFLDLYFSNLKKIRKRKRRIRNHTTQFSMKTKTSISYYLDNSNHLIFLLSFLLFMKTLIIHIKYISLQSMLVRKWRKHRDSEEHFLHFCKKQKNLVKLLFIVMCVLINSLLKWICRFKWRGENYRLQQTLQKVYAL